jgi:hypothetical protein
MAIAGHRSVTVLTEIELDELVRQLQDQRRSPDRLWDRIVDQMGSRIWKSAEWRKRRAAVLKSCCVDCGSTDVPFTLQHRGQPPAPSEVFWKYCNDPSNPEGFPQWFELSQGFYDIVTSNVLLVVLATQPMKHLVRVTMRRKSRIGHVNDPIIDRYESQPLVEAPTKNGKSWQRESVG